MNEVPRQNLISEIKSRLARGAVASSEPDFYFYDSLVVLDSVQPNCKETAHELIRVKQNQDQFQKKIRSAAAANQQQKFHLIEAEKYRVLGNKNKATLHYELAITNAQQNAFVRCEAIANELAASFYFECRENKLATIHVKEACRCYRSLGENSKADFLLRQNHKETSDNSATTNYINTLGTFEISSTNHTEQKLKKINEKFHKVLECSAIGIWEWIPGKDILIWDNRMFKIYGVDPDDFQGTFKDWSDRLHPDESEKFNHEYWLQQEGMNPTENEFRIIQPTGDIRLISAYLYFEKDKSGQLLGIVGLNKDITASRKTEIALKESEQQFHRMTENVPGVLYRYVVHADDSEELVYVSSQVREIFGVEPEEAMSNPGKLFQKIHPDDQDQRLQDYKESRETLQPFTNVCRICLPNNEVRWIKSMTSRPEQLKNGDVVWDGVVIDISDLKRIEAEKERQAAIIENTSDFIGTADPYGNTTYGNRAMKKLIHSHLDQPEQRSNVADIYPHWVSDILKNEGRPEAIRHGVWTGETALLDSEGNEFPVSQVLITHKTLDGEVEYFSTICRDIRKRKKTELDLEEAKARLLRVTENVPGMIFQHEYSNDGNQFVTTLVSSKCKELYGVEQEEVLNNGLILYQWIHPKDIPQLKKAVAMSLEKLEPFTFEFRVTLPGQSMQWHRASGSPEPLENGNISVAGICFDITDQKVAELAHQQTQEQFQRTTENVPGMIYRYIRKADGSHFMDYVSSKCRDLYEIEPEEVLEGTSALYSRIHPQDADRVLNSARTSANNLTPLREEHRVILPTQGLCWRQISAQPSRSDNGDIIWDGVVLDITERKAAELALQETQLRFKRMTENVPGMIYRYVRKTDGTHYMDYVSSKCRDLYEIDPAEALQDASKLFTCMHPGDVARVNIAVENSAEQLTPFIEEFRLILPTMGLRWRQTFAQPSRNEDGATIWDGIVVDITDLKQAELQMKNANVQLAKATQMKDEFLANMSHELRTPLTAILGMNEGLQKGFFGPVTNEQAESFETIEKSGAHLLELINEVLDLAKIESGFIELEPSPVDINKICDSSLQLVAPQARVKNIELDFHIPTDTPLLHTDEKRLRQILINLLDNAIKFTDTNGIVTLSVEKIKRTVDGSDEMIRFTVTDTGIGISNSHWENLFEPFVQVQTGLNRDYGGTGLGLSLVKQFTELLGGETGVTSELGVGSSFYIDLPTQQSKQSNSTCHDESNPNKTTGLRQNNVPSPAQEENNSALILLAEDNESVAKTTRRYLEFSNFQVILVTDGEAALKAAREDSPDIILMDVQMPGVDGLEAIRRLRKIPSLTETPVIALTGLAMRGDSNRCIEAGADHYLSKPYRMQELVDLVEHYLHATV